MQRPATHSGSWYSNHSNSLASQIKSTLVHNVVPGTRILVGPHAGYTYSSKRLGETFSVFDLKGIKRIFILGPSHHVYFRNYVMISKYDTYETPLGNLNVDTDVCHELNGSKYFKYMSEEADQDEHSFEMHCPYIAYRVQQLRKSHDSHQDAKIVPIMISSIDENTVNSVVDKLTPFFKDKSNAFIISSDFCHWGSRFGYTEYYSEDIDVKVLESEQDEILNQGLEFLDDEPELMTLSSFTKTKLPIYKSIENLDKLAMSIAQNVSASDWHTYIQYTGNTICGEKPIWVVLKLLESLGSKSGFTWIGYSQSSKVKNYFESSVSYASGYVREG